MKAIVEYKCRLCGTLYRSGDPIDLMVTDGNISNVQFSAPTFEAVVTESVYPHKESRYPLIKYHICASQDVGVSDFAGFVRWSEQ